LASWLGLASSVGMGRRLGARLGVAPLLAWLLGPSPLLVIAEPVT
jgi:hypothetical protein